MPPSDCSKSYFHLRNSQNSSSNTATATVLIAAADPAGRGPRGLSGIAVNHLQPAEPSSENTSQHSRRGGLSGTHQRVVASARTSLILSLNVPSTGTTRWLCVESRACFSLQSRQAMHSEPAAGQACSCLARVCPSSGRRVSPRRSAARVAPAPLLPHPDRGCHCALVEPRRQRWGCGVCEKPLGRGKMALRYFVRGFSPALRVIRLNHTPGRAGVSPQPSWAAAARPQQRGHELYVDHHRCDGETVLVWFFFF